MKFFFFFFGGGGIKEVYYEICASKELINRENVISSYCVFNRATYDEKKKETWQR